MLKYIFSAHNIVKKIIIKTNTNESIVLSVTRYFKDLFVCKRRMNFCGAQRRFSLLSNIIIHGLYHELSRGVARIFQRGGGSHCVKHYRHGVFATEYGRLFA